MHLVRVFRELVLLWIGLNLLLVDDDNDDDDDLCVVCQSFMCLGLSPSISWGFRDVCFLPDMIYFDGNLDREGCKKGTLCICVFCFNFFGRVL